MNHADQLNAFQSTLYIDIPEQHLAIHEAHKADLITLRNRIRQLEWILFALLPSIVLLHLVLIWKLK